MIDARPRSFEPVHVFAAWCNGPRDGLADFDGRPHLYLSMWIDDPVTHGEPYDTPTREDVFALIPLRDEAAGTLLDALRAHCDPPKPTLHPPWGSSGKDFRRVWSDFYRTHLNLAEQAITVAGEMRPREDWLEPLTHYDDPLQVQWSLRAPGRVSGTALRNYFAELERRRAIWAEQNNRPPPVAGDEVPF